MLAVDRLDRAWGREVGDGVRRLEAPPEWLHALKDPEHIAASLRRWVPELASSTTLHAIEAVRVRLRDDDWIGRYALSVETRGGEAEPIEITARAVHADEDEPAPGPGTAPFASAGWNCFVPDVGPGRGIVFRMQPPDDALGALPLLTDAEAARVLLQRIIRGASPAYAGLRIESCTPRVMRYKPGSRCTILYDLAFPDGDGRDAWPNPVVAKTHHGEKGHNAHESMRALWDSPLRHSEHVTIAEPLGFSAGDNILVQGPIAEERTLKQQLRHSLEHGGAEIGTLRRYFEATARGLADLHGCGVTVGEVWTFEDELAEVRDRVRRLSRWVPDIEDASEPVLSRLEAVAAAHPADPIGPTHRSFRPAQVLIHGDDIGFIDFDSFCRAEPALDVGLFFSTTRDLSLRTLQDRDGHPAPGEPPRPEHLELLDGLSEAFLEAYLATTSVTASIERILLWHALLVFDRLILCWTKDRPERLAHCSSLLTHLYSSDRVSGLVA